MSFHIVLPEGYRGARTHCNLGQTRPIFIVLCIVVCIFLSGTVSHAQQTDTPSAEGADRSSVEQDAEKGPAETAEPGAGAEKGEPAQTDPY
ncbi:MAG: hypothetical protein ACOC7U_03100, partial [Spirochaetota bacterium]